jgi:hypothetical protein
MIAIKLGLGISTVKQYLGIVEPDENAVTKLTYVKPKKTYVEPKATFTEPKATTQSKDQLSQDINQLNKATFAWPKLLDKPLPSVKIAAPWDYV